MPTRALETLVFQTILRRCLMDGLFWGFGNDEDLYLMKIDIERGTFM